MVKLPSPLLPVCIYLFQGAGDPAPDIWKKSLEAAF